MPALASARAARSILSSVAGRQAVTRLVSIVVTPAAIRASRRGKGAGNQLRPRRLARRTHRRDDAAASARDLLIARTGQSHRPFIGAVAAVHEVGVAVDQAGVISRPLQSVTLCAVAGAPSAGPA